MSIFIMFLWRNKKNINTVITLSIETNSVDPDQTPQNAASDQSLHCLPYTQQYSRHIKR